MSGPSLPPPPLRQRHGCLTAWLGLVIVTNSLVSLTYLVLWVVEFPVGAESWVSPVLMVVGLVNVVCAVALLRWQGWCSWGFVVSSAVVLFINLTTVGLGLLSGVGLLGIAVLYGLLQLGIPKAWHLLD